MSAVGGRNTTMSPALVGAVTVLIIVITTFLAYNANSGLPWVPSKSVTVEVENVANIVNGNEVRIGGTRVGIVTAMRPIQHKDGRTTAELDLKLDQNTQPLPVDTLVQVRARSLLGLKYVQLTPGDSKKTVPDGGRLPLENAKPRPVEVDELFNTFDDPTREGIITAVTAFGDALSGRGIVIGALLDDAGDLSRYAEPVVRLLADEQNGLMPFLGALGRFTGELADAGQATGGLFRGLDRTLGALARADASLDAALHIAPASLAATATSLRNTRGLIGPHIVLTRDLAPAVRAAADSASNLAAATRAGVRGLADTPRFARQFGAVLTQLDRTAKSTIVARGLDGVTQLAASGEPLFLDISRAQTICGYGSLMFRNIASATADGDAAGNWLRVVPYLPPYVNNGEGTHSAQILNGATVQAGFRATSTEAARNTAREAREAGAYLYTNPLPATGAGGRCEPGYETRPFYASPQQRQQQLTIGARGLTTTRPFKTSPPIGSSFPNALTAEEED